MWDLLRLFPISFFIVKYFKVILNHPLKELTQRTGACPREAGEPGLEAKKGCLFQLEKHPYP
jgi:hypothetical protein